MKQDLEKQRAQFEENIKELQAKLEAAGISDGTPVRCKYDRQE